MFKMVHKMVPEQNIGRLKERLCQQIWLRLGGHPSANLSH